MTADIVVGPASVPALSDSGSNLLSGPASMLALSDGASDIAPVVGRSLAELVVRGGQVLALGLLAAGIAVVAAFLFRWYAQERVPEGVAILLGLSAIALVLNTTAALALALSGTIDGIEADAPFTIAAFAVGIVGADLGRRLGDRLGDRVVGVSRLPRIESEVGQLVKAKGRVLRVVLPDEIEDIEGYDPVEASIKADLAGAVLLFPRRITTSELRSRLVDRLKADYGVGHVDVELEADGTVEYLAVGSRTAGIGPTIDPGGVAVAIRADPANAASPGDRVEIWRTDDEPQRVARGDLRATAGDVVTVAVDAEDADALAAEGPYKLSTVAAGQRPDREFASLLRAADETMSSITVEDGTAIVGTPLSALEVTVAAIRSDGDVDAIPPGDRTLAPGDVVYAVGRPDRLRKLEAAASGVAPTEGTVPGIDGVVERAE